MKRHPRYPQTLISFQHLVGGSYGTLTMVARDPNTLEVQLGNDFVRMDADGASRIAQALECFAGAETVVEVREEVEETEVVVEPPDSDPRLPRPRRGAPRRRPSPRGGFP